MQRTQPVDSQNHLSAARTLCRFTGSIIGMNALGIYAIHRNSLYDAPDVWNQVVIAASFLMGGMAGERIGQVVADVFGFYTE